MNDASTAASLHEQVGEVLNRYLAALDDGDVPRVLTCFADDARVRYLDGTFEMSSREEMREFFTRRDGPRKQGLTSLEASVHALASFDVTEPSSGRLAATSFCLVYHSGHIEDDQVLIQRAVRYQDELVHDDGRMVIRDRVHTTLWHHVTKT